MHLKLALGLSLLALSLSGFAQGSDRGGHDGGGGNGVVCYNPQGLIESVELLDFFEGRMLEGLSIPEYQGNYKAIYQSVIEKSASSGILKTMKQGNRLQAGFKFLPEGVRLNPINDSSEIFIPVNCKIEQLANFQGLSRIFIVKDFWNKLSETAKAGLLMHEFLWYMERESGAKKSSRARRTVARFFADNFEFEKINHNVKLGDVHCSATNPNHRVNEFTIGNSFFISHIKNTNSCVLSFNILNSILAFSKHTATLEFCNDWEFDKVWYTDANRSGRIITNTSETIEVMDHSEGIMSHEVTLSLDTKFNQNQLPEKKIFRYKVSNKEFPGYDEKTVELDCHPINENDLANPWWL